ncbi:hypothetical protein [Fodinibius sp. Rm-B-1B1-1]|uniref:hypothetical protein n=1 Tax=Fodinibius alkaliphilus TaxID=3140241 RepID=UPI00315A86D5
MRNEDNDCIRYLMKEMDPSEELLMEREMMEDEDLLIEVESMRQTLKKLDRLPEVEPPSHVQESIMQKAAEQAEKNRSNNSSVKPIFKYAVAATLALTVSAGGAWLFIGEEKVDSQQTTTTMTASSPASATTPTSTQGINQVSAGATGGSANTEVSATQFAGSNVERQSPSTSAPQRSSVDPWIDRDDILHFEDQFSNQDSQFQTILQQSTQKLQLIQESTFQNNRVNSIQLTGSGN